MPKLKAFVILAGIIFFITALGGAFYMTQRTVFNDAYETGNTAGNLNNKGLFCEQNGIVFFSNAYDIKVNPASTMKPIFSYLLALEHLSYNSSTILKDEPYTYFDGTSIHNADKKYLGKLTLLEALGYSRNTTAVSTLSLL